VLQGGERGALRREGARSKESNEEKRRWRTGHVEGKRGTGAVAAEGGGTNSEELTGKQKSTGTGERPDATETCLV